MDKPRPATLCFYGSQSRCSLRNKLYLIWKEHGDDAVEVGEG